ncbi:MAG: hypothetical protein HY900_33780 [Deltaproteobacteria bacterium]|nr:hypothetical protein [Deltaproteobacteria bacterium]
MQKNLTMKMGSCNHRRYIPELLEYVESGVVDPSRFVTKVEPLSAILDAYKAFDHAEPGWMKVEIAPAGEPPLLQAA